MLDSGPVRGQQIFSLTAWVAVVVCGATASVTAGQRPGQSLESSDAVLEQTVNRYCLGCHNDQTRTAGLSLQGVSATTAATRAPILEKVLQKLRAGEMPPAGRPRPDVDRVATLVAWLETELDRVAAAEPKPGAPAIHRLNRAEYRNAVRDLLALDLDHARDLPTDDSGYGFDNIGDVLTVSPLHIEKYVAAARRVSRMAGGTVTPRPVVEKYSPPRGTSNEAVGGLPPNERAGILFRHYFPFDADYTFLNERLADFYGIEGVDGGYFRRVSLAGTERGGILTHGSILMVTSYPTRTSPVLRGKWVLENLLGAPPPPPPPDVPALADGAENSARGLRAALELHRANPACAVCHSRLDPLGFALENFDAVGMFRTEDDGVAIEASGALPDGTRVDGARGLRDVLLARRQEFVETLADKLLTYALGRGLESSDRPAVREIRRRVETQDYRFSALVAAIVDSVPFRLRRIPEP